MLTKLTKLQWIKDNYPLCGWTEEQAKDLCVEMWNEMAENDESYKSKSKLVSAFKPDVNCFACAYYAHECAKCPFTTYAAVGSSRYVPCIHARSPYKLWEHATYKPDNEVWRKVYAIEIADLFMD